MKSNTFKKLLLGLGLGSTVALAPVALTISCGCVPLKDRVPTIPGPNLNPPEDQDKPENDGSLPPSLDNDNINELINDIPSVSIDESTNDLQNPKKLQLLPYASLIKYATQILRLKNSETNLVLDASKMREKYVELRAYAKKFRIAGEKVKRSWLETSPTITPTHWQQFDSYMALRERIFWNESIEYGKDFEAILKEEIGSWIIVSETYIQANANMAVADIIVDLCDLKIALIDLNKESASSNGMNLIKNSSKIKFILNNLGFKLYNFFNPLQAGTACLQLNDTTKYFLYAKGPSSEITDNAVGLKYLIMLANQEIGPLAEWFAINSPIDFYPPSSFDKPLVYKMNGGAGFRNLATVINRHTSQTIKWYGEFGNQESINTWFKKWFNANKRLFGWNFNLENNNK